MTIYKEFKWLQALHKIGMLTEAEFEDAKFRVLAGAGLEASLVQLRSQREITRLDQDWAEERKSYLRRARSGCYCLPNTDHIYITGIIASFLFLGLLYLGVRTSYEMPLAIVGFLGMIVEYGVTAAKISAVKAKADAYNEAYNAYQQKREALKVSLRDRANNPGIPL